MPKKEHKVKHVCKSYKNGKIDLRNESHVRAMLRSEGDKRVESFLFENLFIENIDDKLSPSSGWIFQYPEDKPDHWFRLVTDDNPLGSGCDKHVINFLDSLGKEVVEVRPTERGFSGQRKTSTGWSEERSLHQTLRSITGWSEPKGTPRNYSRINQDRNKAATQKIIGTFSRGELESLGASRNLINCFLYPWYKMQPMDIDVAVMTNDGLRFVEFKRKYPTRKGTFGIDNHPHGMLTDWLQQQGRPLLHVLLVDPLWRKRVSPLHLLRDDSATARFACWLGLQFTPSTFVAQGGFQTRGRDSGMTGGHRTQREIDRSKTVHLGEGLHPSGLNEFLANPGELEGEDLITYLEDLRDQARQVYE